MRNHAAKAAAAVKICITAALLFFCISDTAAVSAAVVNSIRRCVNVVIPSLFAMMAVSSLIVSSGITGLLPDWLGKPARLLFGMDKNEFAVFVFSMFAGYPVGMKMLSEESASGRIPKKRAEMLSGLCFGAGPAFIYGCISSQIFRSGNAGKLILLSTVSANVVLALIISVPLRRAAAKQPPPRRRVSISADMLTGCVLRSGRAMADICIMITFFSVVTAFLMHTGVTAAAGELPAKLLRLDRSCGEALVAALIDITNVEGLPRGDHLLLPFISGAVSFGGLCVLFQMSVLTAGKLSLRPLIILRSAAALLSCLICRILLPYFTVNKVIEVSTARVSGYASDTAVPSVMLIVMTVLLMWEFGDKTAESSAYST